MVQDYLPLLWSQLLLPVARITLFISIGIFIATFIENLNWTYRLALLARPLVRFGHLSAVTGVSFSVAFLSGVAANTMLAEAYDQARISRRELFIANLFNSLPRFFLHLPTLFFLAVPLIHFGGLLYVGLTFLAAAMQTVAVVFAGRWLLPGGDDLPPRQTLTGEKTGWKEAAAISFRRLRPRLLRVLKYMIPVYILFFLFNRYGLFSWLEGFLASRAWFLAWLNPQSLSIVILQVTTEFSAGLAAAGALLAENSLSPREVVLALLAGNILAAPVRAIRHQLPYYTGIYPPRLAVQLVVFSQLCRAGAVAFITALFYFFG